MTPETAPLTLADSWTEVPACMLLGGSRIATLGLESELMSSIATVACAGLSGNGLEGSVAAYVNESGPE